MTIDLGTAVSRPRPVAAAQQHEARQIAAAFARRSLWRFVLSIFGGVTRSGSLPRTGCVVVANHNSHADTVALLSALPARSKPVVVAAADYWFANRSRSIACRTLGAGVPVRRHGGGRADLLRLAELASAGHAVVVFPEGTRSRTGELGDFHTGAFLLAEAAGVPIIPVGIVGTRRLLAPSGVPRLSRVEVHIGAPLQTASPDAARVAVAVLAQRRGQEKPDSNLRQRIASHAASRRGLAFAAVWGLAEALSLPIVTELVVVLAVLAAPRAWWRLAIAGAIGATVGAAIGWTLAAYGVRVPAPLTTPRMHAVVAAQVDAEGARALVRQPISGVPFKVYVTRLGATRAPIAEVIALSFPLRLARLLGVALVAALVGAAIRRVSHFYPVLAATLLSCFAVGLSNVVKAWQ